MNNNEYNNSFFVCSMYVTSSPLILFQMSKQSVAPNGEAIPFQKRLVMAGMAGGCGGLVGTPGTVHGTPNVEWLLQVQCMEHQILVYGYSRYSSWNTICWYYRYSSWNTICW